ncbi:MAG: N-6 DNA methylase [Leptospirillum sp.]
MASEDLGQRYPDGKGKEVGRFEVFESQTTTINQYALHGVLPNRDYKPHKTQKPDALVIERTPEPHAVVVGEHKAPGELSDANWRALAHDLLVTKCHPTEAPIGYLTDGIRTYWLNGRAVGVVLIEREDSQAMPQRVDYADESFATELTYIADYFDPDTSTVRKCRMVDPHGLSQEVWQSIWRLRADRPEDCLATFVELFIFKFLDDLGLMTTDDNGLPVSLSHVMSLDKDKSYAYYSRVVRPHIKRMFPSGSDGYGIINGIVLQEKNRDHNMMFHEIMRKFIRFGSLKNTDPDFKRRLYESFLQESDTTSTFGQFFTPRVIVTTIHEMAGIAELPHGSVIYDPASGVGGFVLEQMARNLSAQWALESNEMHPSNVWMAHEIVPKTTILAKANALVHCGEFLAEQPGRIPSFAAWLNDVFICYDKTALGSLANMSTNLADVIMTNPPFVVSGSRDIGRIVRSDNRRRQYFDQRYSGVEGLFVQFVIKALKGNGSAWILLPESFFLRTTDASLRDWILRTCQIRLLAILPERTFYNTPKRVVIAHLKKRPRPLATADARAQLQTESTLLYAVSEIGETRDARRLSCATDLPALVQAHRLHLAGQPPKDDLRAVVVNSVQLYERNTMNLRHFWGRDTAVRLDLVGAGENPTLEIQRIQSRVVDLRSVVEQWETLREHLVEPRQPSTTRSIRLGDSRLFALRIGKRVLKKDVYENHTGYPLYSANVRKRFGYVVTANAGGLPYGGALWSLDSDFDCREVSAGEQYSITDHCGEIQLATTEIDATYLAYQVRQSGAEQGFNREYRPSLKVIRDLEITLPVTEEGQLDLELMQEWATFLRGLERAQTELRLVP